MSIQVLLGWLMFGVRFLVALAIIGAALTVVRRAHMAAGLMVAAAAAIQIFTSAVWRVGMLFIRGGRMGGEAMDAMLMLTNLLSIGTTLLTGVLISAALVMLAGAARSPSR
jgi:hypothetical protein